MHGRFQYSLGALLKFIGLAFIGFVASYRCLWVRGDFVQLEVLLAAAGASLGGAIGLFFGRPIRGAAVGVITAPVIVTAVLFVVVTSIMGRVQW